VALIAVLLAGALLVALGAALVVGSQAETMIAHNHRLVQEAVYAADAGIERAAHDLWSMPDWDRVLDGSASSSFMGTSTTPALPAGGTLDLVALTASLQRATDAQHHGGANRPVWRLFSCGRLDAMLPFPAIQSTMYLAVWAADDSGEADNNPFDDSNGALTLHSQAFGPGGTRRVVEATVGRTPAAADPDSSGSGPSPPGLRVLSWREIR
jgi:hypothetical protein